MNTHELVITSVALERLARRLAATRMPLVLRCGLSRVSQGGEWLLPDALADAGSDDPFALVAVAATHPEILPQTLASLDQPHDGRLLLAMGMGPAVGHFAGRAVLGGRWPLNAVRVVGPGLPVWRTDRPAPLSLPREVQARYRRTIGALGEETFARLRSLRCAAVGCGRLGTLVAEHLASLGVAAVALIDPDALEPHNLGEMPLALSSGVGRPKVEVVAEWLRREAEATVRAVPTTVQALDGVLALKAADVVISCADNLAARQATGTLAGLYLRPVLDIGTGVVEGGTGLDVRWLPPGRCVGCVGSDRASEPRRRGSLRSLNLAAVGVAMGVLESVATGTLAGPLWLQGEWTTTGLRLAERPIPPGRDCPSCRAAGTGDRGLAFGGSIQATGRS